MKQFETLSKGLYKHDQIKDFIYVKQYIFSKKGNKKYLAIRFENGSDVLFDRMSFTVTTLDSKGAVIENIPIECKKMNARPKECFEYDRVIKVTPGCADFKVSFGAVYSGEVMYTEHGGRMVARYVRESKREEETGSYSYLPPKPEKKHTGWMKLLALLALVAIVGGNVLYIVNSIQEETTYRREIAYQRHME